MELNKYGVGVYKKAHALTDRLEQSKFVLDRYPDKIPVIIEYSNDFPSEFRTLHKQKYLIPTSYKLSDLLGVIRKQIHLASYKSLCLLSDTGTLFRVTDLMDHIYSQYKHKDDFLYVTIIIESTFG